MTIAIYSHEDCLRHDPGPGHPESPARLRVILEALKDAPFAGELAFLEAPAGSDEQVLLAHDSALLAHIRAAAPSQGRVSLDPDTHLSPGSLEAALRGVGGACRGVQDLLEGRYETAFCATRPPGHHATAARAMGFCLFNHAAIAALLAQGLGLERVALVDFDVHHGNGSQDILAGKQGILYVSTHQSPLYPGTGWEEDNIAGNIANFPLPSGSDGGRYRALFEARIQPLLEDFRPQLILASAGFDAHQGDPLASLALHEDDYRWIGGRLRELAQPHGQGRVLGFLEGGYNLQVLGKSARAFVEGLIEAARPA